MGRFNDGFPDALTGMAYRYRELLLDNYNRWLTTLNDDDYSFPEYIDAWDDVQYTIKEFIGKLKKFNMKDYQGKNPARIKKEINAQVNSWSPIVKDFYPEDYWEVGPEGYAEEQIDDKINDLVAFCGRLIDTGQMEMF